MFPIVRHHFRVLDSTNTWAMKHCESFSKDALTVITADEQTAGRGRRNQKWVSQPFQDILISFCFFVPNPKEDIVFIPQVLALTVCQLLKKEGVEGKIKWPNDVLVNQKKMAGILCETSQMEDQLAVILGLGLNVNMPPEELQHIDQPATSLSVETQRKKDLYALTDRLIEQFSHDLPLFLKTGWLSFSQASAPFFLPKPSGKEEEHSKKLLKDFKS